MATLDPDLPLTVKIGGPEARTDLRNLVDLDIPRFVAPMIESPFAVLKAVQNATATTGRNPSGLEICLNLESVAAHAARREILGCRAAAAVAKVNVGRTDLAASLDAPVESPEVLAMTRDIVAEARRTGKGTGVGGSLAPATIETLLDACRPDEFETRHVIFTVARVRDAAAAVTAALRLELALISWMDGPRVARLRDAEIRAGALHRRLSSRSQP
jgi:hypothetical protein